MSSAIVAAVGVGGGLAGLTIGTFLSETIKSAVGLVFRQSERRADQVPAMRSVVLNVDSMWKPGGYYYDGLDIATLDATLTLENHSGQLIKNVRASMHKRPNGVDTARMVPAVPANGSTQIVITRELGLLDDQPFEEDQTYWLNLYWFEVLFEDTHGNRWRLYFNPRDDKQYVERATG
jgi:hypothetical protein